MMKNTGPVFSLLLVCFAGMLIFTGVFYLEKKEKHQKEEEAGQEKEKEEETLPKEDIVGEVVVGDTQGESVPLEETVTEEQEDRESVLVFAGDVYLSRHVAANYDREGIDLSGGEMENF